MFKLKSAIFYLIIILLTNGCFGLLVTAGSVASVGVTAQEVDEDYDGSLLDYIKDKTSSFYEYLKKKSK